MHRKTTKSVKQKFKIKKKNKKVSTNLINSKWNGIVYKEMIRKWGNIMYGNVMYGRNEIRKHKKTTKSNDTINEWMNESNIIKLIYKKK